MSLSTFAPKVGGTTSTTGGVATALIRKNSSGKKAEFILDDSSPFVTQTEIDFSVVEPVVKASAPNGYTQKRNSTFIKIPVILANGNRTVKTYQLLSAVDVETTDAEYAADIELLVQCGVDAALADFRNKQSLV